GIENVVSDALSRVTSGVELNALVLTSITTNLLQKVKDNWVNDVQEHQVLMQLQSQTYKKDKYTLVDVILKRKGKIVVGNDLQLRMFIYHADAMGGH
ncbi:hypothetical protein Tco_0112738, partial [Tanacetum coccineum]